MYDYVDIVQDMRSQFPGLWLRLYGKINVILLKMIFRKIGRLFERDSLIRYDRMRS